MQTAIIEEIRFTQPENMSITFKYLDKYKLIEVERTKIDENSQVIAKHKGFPAKILYDINKIPVTEDYTTIYTLLKEFNYSEGISDLVVDNTNLFNSNIRIAIEDGQINLMINLNVTEISLNLSGIKIAEIATIFRQQRMISLRLQQLNLHV